MKISDLKIVIENPSGSYKKFANSTAEYPIIGVTYPTHYGYIEGYKSEDGHDLDVFVGNGEHYGTLQVKRGQKLDELETKVMLGVSQDEVDKITEQFKPVLYNLKIFGLAEFLSVLGQFKANDYTDQ